jgi:hypothetical protein
MWKMKIKLQEGSGLDEIRELTKMEGKDLS